MSYFESLDSNLELEPTPIGVSFSTLEYTHDSFLSKLNNGDFSPTKVKSIIESNISLYFGYEGFSNIKTRMNMQSIWTNINFLRNVLELLNEDQKFRQNVISGYRRDINIIANDYISVNNDGKEEYIKDSKVRDTLLAIASNVNAEYIVPLSSKIPIAVAQHLALANFCTFDTSQAVRNIIGTIWNYSIKEISLEEWLLGFIRQNTELHEAAFTIEQIIYIYYTFFKDNFSEAFVHSMLFRYPRYGEASSMINVEQTDNNISSALINILNSMSSKEVKEVLAKYANYLSFCGDKVKKVRFSLRHLPNEFKNVAQCVAEAEQNGYYIP